MRGFSWPPSGPLPPGDALKASRVDTPTPRPLTVTRRSLSCPLFLTPPLVVATARRGTAAPPRGATPAPVTPAAIAGEHGCHCLAEPLLLVGRGCGNGWRTLVWGKQKL